MRVLVTGATGFVGGRLVPELRDRGHDVVALVRDASRYDRPPGVTVVEGDLLDPGSFDAALNVEAAYYLVHSMRAGEDFEERDRRAARNFVTAAGEAGVERIVYLGGLGEDRDRLSDHLRSRREVESILDRGAPALTTLRAAIVIGAGSSSFELVRQLVQRLPVMITPRWVRTPCQPIAVDDAVAYLAGVLDAPETADDTFEIGGPDVLSYRDIMETVADQLGRRLVVVPVPVLTPKLSAYWVELMTDVPRSVVRPLILGLRNPVVVRDDRIRDHVSVESTPFETAVARALDERRWRSDAADAGEPSGPDPRDSGTETPDAETGSEA